MADKIKIFLGHLDPLLTDNIDSAQNAYGGEAGRDSFREIHLVSEDVTLLLNREQVIL